MMRRSDFKKKYDPELGRYTRQHIHGEGVMDVFKSFGSKLFGNTMKTAAKTAANKAITTAATKTGEYAGKKASDKIVKMLEKDYKKEYSTNTPKKAGDEIVKMLEKDYKKEYKNSQNNTFKETIPTKKTTEEERYQKLNNILND